MRRQESPKVRVKSAGRNEAGRRSEMQSKTRQRFSGPKVDLRFAPPAVVALGGDGATHRVHQNDMPPLPGLLLSASLFTAFLENLLTAVSAPFAARSCY
jgi:hypothetical protein